MSTLSIQPSLPVTIQQTMAYYVHLLRRWMDGWEGERFAAMPINPTTHTYAHTYTTR